MSQAMFEDTSDSFDSSSDSDAESHPVERAQDAPQAAEPSNGSSTVKPRAPAMTQAKLFDNEELEGSTSSSVFRYAMLCVAALLLASPHQAHLVPVFFLVIFYFFGGGRIASFRFPAPNLLNRRRVF